MARSVLQCGTAEERIVVMLGCGRVSGRELTMLRSPPKPCRIAPRCSIGTMGERVTADADVRAPKPLWCIDEIAADAEPRAAIERDETRSAGMAPEGTCAACGDGPCGTGVAAGPPTAWGGATLYARVLRAAYPTVAWSCTMYVCTCVE